MAEKTKQDLEIDFSSCCIQIIKEQIRSRPDSKKIVRLKKTRSRIAKGINIMCNPKRLNLSFADVGRH